MLNSITKRIIKYSANTSHRGMRYLACKKAYDEAERATEEAMAEEERAWWQDILDRDAKDQRRDAEEEEGKMALIKRKVLRRRQKTRAVSRRAEDTTRGERGDEREEVTVEVTTTRAPDAIENTLDTDEVVYNAVIEEVRNATVEENHNTGHRHGSIGSSTTAVDGEVTVMIFSRVRPLTPSQTQYKAETDRTTTPTSTIAADEITARPMDKLENSNLSKPTEHEARHLYASTRTPTTTGEEDAATPKDLPAHLRARKQMYRAPPLPMTPRCAWADWTYQIEMPESFHEAAKIDFILDAQLHRPLWMPWWQD